MSRLEKLIRELCPDGVEYKRLGDICKVLRGKRLTKSQLSEEGKYPVLHGGSSPMGYYGEYNRKAGTTVVVNTGNAGSVFYYEQEFWSSDACFSLYPSGGILDRYLYHYVVMCEPILKGKIRSGAMPTIDSLAVESLIIPVPPLPVQREIVRILDSFTELTAELEAELEARKKQYEYYRDQLLNFDAYSTKTTAPPRKTLNEVCKVYRGVRVIKKDLLQEGRYPVYQNSLTPMGYYEQCNRTAETFVISAGAAGEIGYSAGDFWAADDCFTFECSNQISNRYLYHVLMSMLPYILSRVRKASVPRLSREVIEKLTIPVPPLAEQARIVSVLDRFDALCNDLTSGLPAEIAARQKQYEYYRDRLLNFKRIG